MNSKITLMLCTLAAAMAASADSATPAATRSVIDGFRDTDATWKTDSGHIAGDRACEYCLFSRVGISGVVADLAAAHARLKQAPRYRA
jgi:hypothetical protein